jgi:protein-S-isoprenylcysteine O-methyltransferase Ste14
MEKFEGVSIFKLITRFVNLVKSFFSKEKKYVKQIAQDTVKNSLPVLIMGIAGLVLLALSGIFFLVTFVLILNIWFLPWASALITTVLLMLGGLILGFAAFRTAQKEFGETQKNISRVREDLRWLRKS